MDTREAFEAIRSALDADPCRRIVESRYEELIFGNFIIAFEHGGRPRSIVNDRGELCLCNDLSGSKGCALILPSLWDVDQQGILRALEL